ncbi:MAG: prolipoprotein diacylglyceryl transferase [Christensenellales bacterium]|nr:prolipoprotein diacylglyceryl transferase [Christensenellales bacterium]
MLSRPMIDRIAFFGISWYAILIVGAVLIGLAFCTREARRLNIPQDTLIDFLLYAIPLAIVCARIYYVIFRFNMFSEDLWSIFNIREGGLAIYGGVIGGLIAAKIAARKHHVSVWTLLDIVAPALVLGQGIGRWGNYINMEAYGLRINEEYLQFFPFAVEIPVGDVWYWHMATFFYEFCWDVLVFALLLVIRHHKRRNGDVFCWYLLLYCAGRTVIEGLRNDSLTFISEFVRISQVLSAIAAFGVVIYFFVRIRDRISLVTIAPLICAVLCLVTTFLGEFERGAYSTLFPFSQGSLVLLILVSVAMIALWTVDSGAFDWRTALPLLLNAVFIAGLLIAGVGRANADNTYYVSLRQCAAMIQLILCGWLLCYPFCPDTKKVRRNRHA